MVKDRVVLNGLTADMWTPDQNEHVKRFLTDTNDKLLVLRVANETLVSVTPVASILVRVHMTAMTVYDGRKMSKDR